MYIAFQSFGKSFPHIYTLCDEQYLVADHLFFDSSNNQLVKPRGGVISVLSYLCVRCVHMNCRTMRMKYNGGVWKNTNDAIFKAAAMNHGKNQWRCVLSLLLRNYSKQ